MSEQPIQLTAQVFAVEVPEGAINFTIDMGYLIFKVPNYANWCTDAILSDYNKLSKYLETHSAENDYKRGGIPLPGNWQLICTTKEATWKQACEVIERDADGWKDYDKNNCLPLPNPFAALRSLFTSKGLDPEKNYVLIKKLP